MSKVSLWFSFILLAHFLHAQVDTVTILNTALTEGEKMNTAFHTGDYDTFIEYNHPKLIKLSGGKNKMKELISSQTDLQDVLISIELSMPKELIIKDSSYQCAFIQKQIMNFDGQKYFTLSTLIGISPDKGKQWFFISATKPLSKLQNLFPELSDDLEVIEQTVPIQLIE